MSSTLYLDLEQPSEPRRIGDVTIDEAFTLLCLFVGAWTIGTFIGRFIGEKINAATRRDVPTG